MSAWSVPAAAFAGSGHSRGCRRCGGGDFLLLQHPDHPGGPQHQDAGYCLPAVGDGCRHIHLQVHFPRREGVEGLAPCHRARQRPFRSCNEHAGQGQPSADHILPGNPDRLVCRDLLHLACRFASETQVRGQVLCGFGPSPGAGPSGHRHECHQACSAL